VARPVTLLQWEGHRLLLASTGQQPREITPLPTHYLRRASCRSFDRIATNFPQALLLG